MNGSVGVGMKDSLRLAYDNNEKTSTKEVEEDDEQEGEVLQRLADLVNIEIGRKTKRPMCEICSRPMSACWCKGEQRQLDHVKSTVLVLQHPHEERRCLRTAPMLENALPNCRIVKGKRFNSISLPELRNPNTVVLFPDASAVDASSLPPVREVGPYTIVVLDGTWYQARAIMHNTRQLHKIKKVVVRSDAVSRYVIRTQPSEAALSTVESTALALAALEDDHTIYSTLVAPLALLCQHQLSHGAVIHHSKEKRYKDDQDKIMGKRTAKTLAQCGGPQPQPDTNDDNGHGNAVDGGKTDSSCGLMAEDETITLKTNTNGNTGHSNAVDEAKTGSSSEYLSADDEKNALNDTKNVFNIDNCLRASSEESCVGDISEETTKKKKNEISRSSSNFVQDDIVIDCLQKQDISVSLCNELCNSNHETFFEEKR